jgi:hypothetical protein
VVGGVRYFIGSGKLVGHASACPSSGTTVYFGWDGATKGAMTFGDRVRPEAVELCRNLRERGVRTLLLSGDSDAATHSVAAEIGADEWKGGSHPRRQGGAHSRVAAARAVGGYGGRWRERRAKPGAGRPRHRARLRHGHRHASRATGAHGSIAGRRHRHARPRPQDLPHRPPESLLYSASLRLSGEHSLAPPPLPQRRHPHHQGDRRECRRAVAGIERAF